MATAYKKFTMDSLLAGITHVLSILGSVILMSLITKTLGEYDYVVWSQASIIVELAVAFCGLGLPYAMSRYLAAQTSRKGIQEDYYSVFLLVFIVSLVITLIVIISAGYFAKIFFDSATQIVRIVGLIILASSLNSVGMGLFRARRQMVRYSIIAIADVYTTIGLVAYLVTTGNNLFSALISLLIVKTLVLIVLSLLIMLQIGFTRPRLSGIKNYLSFGLPTIPANFSAWAVSSSDRFVVSYFLGITSVGIYSVSYGIGTVPMILSTVLGFVLPPTLSKLYDEDRIEEVKVHLSYSLKYFLAFAIPFVFGAAVLSEPVLSLFSTPIVASEGRLITLLVALSSLFGGIYAVVMNVLILVKKTKILAITWIIAALANLILNILIVPHWGIVGAAITTVIAYLLALGITVYYSLREFSFNIEYKFIIKSVVASAVMCLVSWKLGSLGVINVIITVMIGVTVYSIILFLLKGFAKKEIMFFKGFIVKRSSSKSKHEERR